MVQRFKQFIRGSKAVSALEYAILVGVIAVAIAVALTQFGKSLDTAMDNIGNKIATTTATKAPKVAN